MRLIGKILKLFLALVVLAVAATCFILPSRRVGSPVGEPDAKSASTPLMPDNLAAVQTQIARLDQRDAARVIRRWLDSGKDSATGQGFVLAPDGSLQQAPTLRTALLDALIKADPASAAAFARQLLAEKTTATSGRWHYGRWLWAIHPPKAASCCGASCANSSPMVNGAKIRPWVFWRHSTWRCS